MTRIRLWPLRPDYHPGVLIGEGGSRRCDWPARVYRSIACVQGLSAVCTWLLHIHRTILTHTFFSPSSRIALSTEPRAGEPSPAGARLRPVAGLHRRPELPREAAATDNAPRRRDLDECHPGPVNLLAHPYPLRLQRYQHLPHWRQCHSTGSKGIVLVSLLSPALPSACTVNLICFVWCAPWLCG